MVLAIKHNIVIYSLLFLILVIGFVEGLGLDHNRFISEIIFLILVSGIGIIAAIIQPLNITSILKNKQIVLVSLFLIIFSCVSLFFSIDLDRSWLYTIWDIGLLIVFLIGFGWSEQILHHLWKVYIAFSCVMAIMSIIFQVVIPRGSPFIPVTSFQFLLPTSAHNSIGLLIAPSLVILLYKLTRRTYGTIQRLILYFVSLDLFIVLLLSNSRTAYIAFVLMALALFLTTKTKGKRLILIISSIAVFAIIIWSNIQFSSFATAGKQIFGERQNYFSQAIQTIRDYPLTGIGAGNFSYASNRYNFQEQLIAESSHNSILDFASEKGILFAVTMICLFLYFMIKMYQKKNLTGDKVSGLILLITLLISSCLDFTNRYYFFSVIIAILFGSFIHVIQQKEINPLSTVGHIHQSLLGKIFIFLILLFLACIIFTYTQFEHAAKQYPYSDSMYLQGLIKQVENPQLFYISENQKNVLVDYLARHYIARSSVTIVTFTEYIRSGNIKSAQNFLQNVYLWNPQVEEIRSFLRYL